MALSAALGAVKGLTSIAGGLIGSGARRREQRRAQAEFDRRMSEYERMDTSNIYADLPNVYEDLTVNQQQAEFARKQQEQALSQTLGGLQGAAGGSGIAALAQSLAGQQMQAAEQAAVSIGQQESQIAMLQAQEAGRNILRERAGEAQSRELERGKTGTLLGMSQQRLAAANEAQQAATESILGGVGSLAGAGATYMGNLIGQQSQDIKAMGGTIDPTSPEMRAFF